MLDEELKSLEERRNKNIKKAYSNIFKSQTEESLSPVESILSFFGIKHELTNIDLEKQIEEIKTSCDISFRKVSLSGKWYDNGILPLIIYKDGKAKAVIPDRCGRCKVIENGKKVRIKSNEGIDDNAIAFYKGFGKDKIDKFYLLKFMFCSIKPADFLRLFFIMAVFVVLGTLIPQVQYYIFNNLIPAGAASDIRPVAYLLLGIVLVLLSVNIVKGAAASNIPHVINAYMQGAVISRMLSLNTDFFKEKKSGKVSAAVIGLTDISEIISEKTIGSFFSLMLSFVYLIQISVYTPMFVGYVYFTFVVIVVFTVIKFILLRRYEKNFFEKSDDMSGLVYELMGGMENIKLSDSADVMFNRWSKFYSECLKALDRPYFNKYYNALYTLATTFIILVIYYVGSLNDVQSAHFIAFINVYTLFMAAVGGLSDILTAAARFGSAYERAKDFFMAEPETGTLKKVLVGINEAIRFTDVSFKYAGAEQYTLKGINIELKKGSKVGITGKSGCGKSTLLRLLLGFERPSEGRITIDHHDMNEIDIRSYRRRIGVVLQNSGLIPSDILSNIKLTAPEASLEDVYKAVEDVGLKDDIDKMPMGLNTFVSNDNLTISGGQKQRILLARALLAKPDLLVLDEATNALDNITQASVTSRVLNSDVTALIVAHRISTVKDCDRIIFISDGKVAESGSFDELMERKGEFYEMFYDQSNLKGGDTMKEKEEKNEDIVEIDIDKFDEKISGGSLKDVHTRETHSAD